MPTIIIETGSDAETDFIFIQSAESGLHAGDSTVLLNSSLPLWVKRRICQSALVVKVSFHENSGAGNSGGKIVPSQG